MKRGNLRPGGSGVQFEQGLDSDKTCGAAARGEILADADTVTAAGDTRFGPAETISVKGRSNPLQVRRWQAGTGD